MKIHASTVARVGDDAFLEERMNAPSIYVRIVAVRPSGELELECGHVVVRRKRTGSQALCEHCFPLHYARARATSGFRHRKEGSTT